MLVAVAAAGGFVGLLCAAFLVEGVGVEAALLGRAAVEDLSRRSFGLGAAGSAEATPANAPVSRWLRVRRCARLTSRTQAGRSRT